MAYVLRFEQCSSEMIDRVGGKCAGLGSAIAAGFPVPPGFAITADAFRAMLEHNHMADRIHEQLRRVTSSADPRLSEVSERVRALIAEQPVEPAVAAAIQGALGELSERCGTSDIPVAVRSSATAEDLPGASFAGIHDTFLGVAGTGHVLKQVRRCWSSLYTARAVAYRLDHGIAHEKVFMAAGVQKMVNAKAAGVAFTLNPINGDRSKIAIDASWGLGEAVVSGEVTPDNFLVDKVILAVVKQVISPKHIEYGFEPAHGAVVRREVLPERRTQPSLTPDELALVAKMAKRAEAHFNSPQDIEWAIDADRPAGESLMLLQSRPESVWSRKPRTQVTTGHSHGVAGVVHTLIQGVHVDMTK